MKMMKVAVLGMLMSAVALPAAADVFYACPKPDEGASENPNYCRTPALAGTIADALGKCAANDELVLLDGVYVANWAYDGLLVDKPLTIRSYTGNREACVLNGGDDGLPRRAFHIVDTADGTIVSNLTFDCFRITTDVDPNALQRGGAIYGDGTFTLRVGNCVFSRCESGLPGGSVLPPVQGDNPYGICMYGGGAIFMWTNGVIHCADCNFISNRTQYCGGAVFFRYGTFDRCNFIANASTNSLGSSWTFRAAGGALMSFPGKSWFNKIYPNYPHNSESWASNCYFEANSALDNIGDPNKGGNTEGGDAWGINSYRCNFIGGWANEGTSHGGRRCGTHYHIEDVYTDPWRIENRPKQSGNTGNTLDQVSYSPQVFVRCEFRRLSRNNLFAAGNPTDDYPGSNSYYYNCLIDDCQFVYMCGDSKSEFYNCTLTRNSNQRGGGQQQMDWNSSYFQNAKVVNCLMADNVLSSGAITIWNGGPGKAAVMMSNSVYQGHYQGTPWENNHNMNYTNAPPTEYKFVGSGDHPYAYVKDSFGIDWGMEVPGCRDPRDLRMGRELRGTSRVYGAAIDVGCYEYKLKSGLAVRVR